MFSYGVDIFHYVQLWELIYSTMFSYGVDMFHYVQLWS